ncbi:hypothetical protein BV22DRAFT_130872 [Leucogyrophana mollusca]|uniref:Uncharacterized protein n=1 Tax=Leucogyrophana mollusca TaxID=85980 RepID=A0ACB8BWU2_9AGAM|nr:hypothetical protein BV22DRAFT_130872 [Leucogyrophana mollusca]
MFWPLRNPPPPEPVEDTSLQMDPNAVEALKKINSKTFDVEKYIYQPHGKFAFAAQKELITDGLTFDTGLIGEGFSMCIKKGSIADHPVTVFHKLWNASKYWDQFFTELYLFSHPQLLRFLQGDCVPHIINVSHHREGNKAIAMELPHYGVWRTATPGMPVDLKRGVLDAYARIHAQGVLHGDISLHNIFLGT